MLPEFYLQLQNTKGTGSNTYEKQTSQITKQVLEYKALGTKSSWAPERSQGDTQHKD
jgi:hypothetical protein